MKFSFVIALSAITSIASAQRQAGPFVVKETVNCRSFPSTDSRVIRSIPKGTKINLWCQGYGQSIKGSRIWDLVKEFPNCYVADYYVKTGKSGFAADECESMAELSGH